MYSLEYDPYALNKAMKALNIIFIILILLANGLLIFKNVRKGDFMYKPKTLTILSLAIGDVLLALFPVVVQTNMLFNIYAGRQCTVIMPADVYMYYLITFVYGCGLVVLGWEILSRQKNPGLRSMSQALIASSVPWFLGMIIILPLGFANVDWVTCVGPSLAQVRATYIIAVLLPAIGTVVSSGFVKSGVLSRVLHTQTGSNSSPPNQFSNPQINAPPAYSAHGSYPNYQPQHGYTLPPPLVLQTQPGYANVGYQQDRFGNYPTPTMAPVVALSNANLEKTRLLVISVVFLLLVTPYAIYVLACVINDDDLDRLGKLVYIVLGNLFFYLMLLRPVVTPLLMLGYSDM
ncbi:unnamed protein product [Lymnaea stagnalis]|uniref:G-protein coupled receptors family 1 profile domain-containing protein n=1 Tax=Lymnaea stagnalis TaxID=6523 RepID=A0AAV2IHG6_LYMST